MAARPANALQVESSDSPAKPEDYVEVEGCRLVHPYHFDFCCSVKQRWLGKSIIDVFCHDFPALSRGYYLQALADGRLRVEGCEVTAATPLRDGQKMRHFIHRHEPPVPAGGIQVVGQSADMVAVCKPHGMPVHVAGQYRKNTVLGILAAERPDLGPLFPIHRLDKPVSGLLLFGRSPAAAAGLCDKIKGHSVEKVYVARVLGAFPASSAVQPIVADVPLDWDPQANCAAAVPEAAGALRRGSEAQQGQQQGQQAQQEKDQAREQQQGLTREERKRLKKLEKQAKRAAKEQRVAAVAAAAAAAATRTRSDPKPALTEFRLLAVAPDGQTSIVECRPRTGRTHQIRVHLQFLGHPIANDAQYGGTYGGPLQSRTMAAALGVHWGGQQGEDGGPESSKRQRLEEPEAAAAGPGDEVADVAAGAGADAGAAGQGAAAGGAAAGAHVWGGDADAYRQNGAFRSRPEFRLPPRLCDALCVHCPYYAPKDYPLDLRPLWLHARSYSCKEGAWAFSTDPPDWANAEWVPPRPEGGAA